MSLRSTTQTTLALIPYLNCEPFYGGLESLGMEIVRQPPRALGRLAESGCATCGPMAVADWVRLQDRYDLLGDFGIACEGPAHSVLLFGKRDLSQLSGCRVGLTSESSTSVRLLRFLLERNYGLRDVHYSRELQDDDDARLLIGDEALRVASTGLDGFPFVWDLGDEWFGWQALPFVFARWVVAKEVPEEDRQRIADSLEQSLAGWRDRSADIAARRGEELHLEEADIVTYLETFRYKVGEVERLGQRVFEDMLREEG